MWFWHRAGGTTKQPHLTHFASLCYQTATAAVVTFANSPSIYSQVPACGERMPLTVGGGVSFSSGRRGSES